MILRDKKSGDIVEFEAVVLVAPLPNDYDESYCLDYGSIDELLAKWEVVR